jgi:hypothetical protein
MEVLEEAMKKHNFHLDTSSASSLGQTLSASTYAPSISGYTLNVSSSSSSHEWLIDSRASYHMDKDKAVFSTLNDCNTKFFFVGEDRFLSVEGYRKVHLNNGQIKDVLCVLNLSCNFLSVYRITHSSEGKSVLFTPHQVVIRDLKYPQHIVLLEVLMILPAYTSLKTLGHPLFHKYLLFIVMM